MSVETIKISQEDGSKLFGIEPVASTENTSTETIAENVIVETPIIDNGVVVQAEVIDPIISDAPIITEDVVIDKSTEDAQIIIQNDEIPVAPIVEKTTKSKVKIYKDSFQAALNKYYNTVENPDVEGFARAYKANFDGLSAEDILRLDIVNDPYNKGLDKSTIDYLLEQRLSKFDLDPDLDEVELKRNKQLLQREANIVKDKLIESSKKFVSEFESDLDIEVDSVQEQEQKGQTEEEYNAWREAKTQEYTKEFAKYVSANGFIQLQDKDGVINIPVSKEIQKGIVEAAIDPVSFIQELVNKPDGTQDYAKFVQLVAFARDIAGYNSTIIKYGRTLGTDKIVSQMKNEVPLANARPVENATNKSPNDDPASFFKAMEEQLSRR